MEVPDPKTKMPFAGRFYEQQEAEGSSADNEVNELPGVATDIEGIVAGLASYLLSAVVIASPTTCYLGTEL